MYNDVLLRLTKSLYPRGRAWKMPHAIDSPPTGGIFERLHIALALSENRAITDALSTFDSAIPDNANFTADDATDWERRLGIYSAPGTLLADRILAIVVKMNFPGTTAARQHYTFIEDELQAAGFNVYVYENRFLEGSPPGYVTHKPSEVLAGNYTRAVSGFFQSGQAQFGEYATEDVSKIANYLEEENDAGFIISPNYRSTFFIAGATIDSFADVDAVRKTEFRQLILQLKPLQSVGFMFINYV